MRSTGNRAPAPSTSIWSRWYVALVVVVLLAYVNNMALLPVIPLYLESLGGTELMAGIVLAAFSVASLVLRPWIGRLSDAWDPGWVLLLGSLLLAAATLGMLVPAIVILLVGNTLRGIGWAAVNTGAHVVLARLAPLARRGEASGYFSLFMAAGGLIGPPVALYWLSYGGGFTPLLLGCGMCAVAATLIARPLRGARTAEGGGQTTKPPARPAAGRAGGLIARSALLPAALVTLIMASQPAVLGFVPLYAERSGIPASGVTAFYLVSGVFGVLARAVLGWVSDLLGRGVLILTGFVLVTGAVGGLAFTGAAWQLVLVGALYTVGQGMTLPALTAVAIDRAREGEMGLAMATYSASYQVGLGAGGLLAGALISGVGYRVLYLTIMVLCGAGLLVTVVWRRRTRARGR